MYELNKRNNKQQQLANENSATVKNINANIERLEQQKNDYNKTIIKELKELTDEAKKEYAIRIQNGETIYTMINNTSGVYNMYFMYFKKEHMYYAIECTIVPKITYDHGATIYTKSYNTIGELVDYLFLSFSEEEIGESACPFKNYNMEE